MPRPDIKKTTDTIAFIEEHLTEKLDLGVIAKKVHCSPYHLHRTFSQTVRLTIHDYLRRRQLTEAAKRLAASRMPILDIALLAGYESQQAFTKAFKSLYKVSPDESRRHRMYYPLQLPFAFGANARVHDANAAKGCWEVVSATEGDIPAWMELVRLVVDGYPFLDEVEHIGALRCAIRRDHAMVVRDGAGVVGSMLFSHASGEIDFFGIHPLYRSAGIAELLLEDALQRLPEGKPAISLTTYREGDRADTGHRRAFLELGFAESVFMVEYGYPTQKFVLAKDARRPCRKG